MVETDADVPAAAIIESDLEAVGVTAAISAALTEVGIPCNVLAGSRHGHAALTTGSWRSRQRPLVVNYSCRGFCFPPYPDVMEFSDLGALGSDALLRILAPLGLRISPAMSPDDRLEALVTGVRS